MPIPVVFDAAIFHTRPPDAPPSWDWLAPAISFATAHAAADACLRDGHARSASASVVSVLSRRIQSQRCGPVACNLTGIALAG